MELLPALRSASNSNLATACGFTVAGYARIVAREAALSLVFLQVQVQVQVQVVQVVQVVQEVPEEEGEGLCGEVPDEVGSGHRPGQSEVGRGRRRRRRGRPTQLGRGRARPGGRWRGWPPAPGPAERPGGGAEGQVTG